ncbi:DUF6493 family protein [Pontibacter mangrovi]|uniref:Uncharacterized protein n=1 Tax=Pontibacter mangrovi TaxID=2589816 RepID=A0A501W1J9_9BACT|nr:DUF6493 family protein [Pontibacter mangrovi]TPE42475.1 hypothetical protein FJM65_17885 [Pontibacter mangrovi]
MTIQEQLTGIIAKQKEEALLLFLRSLDAKQKKSLVPHVKKLNKEYLEYKPVTKGGSTTFTSKATPVQRQMLGIASFVLFNLSDFDKSLAAAQVLERGVLARVIHWYCPTWFSDFINKYGNAEYVPLFISYEWVMELTEQGYLTPGEHLLAKLLPELIYERTGSEWNFRPEKLLQREITLREHIWYVFEKETGINWSDRYLQFTKASASQQTGWIAAFTTLSDEGKINRVRLLKEALAATNRNFNKILSGWFANLFTSLQPTKEELLMLQKELLQVVSSPHSKVVNMALKYIKALAAEKGFYLEDFLENGPLLLASETKAVVTSTLMVLDTLARKHKDKAGAITQLACQALLHPDDSLQTRVAKLVVKYGKAADPALREAVTTYHDSLFVHTRNLLQDFVATPERIGASLQELPGSFSEEPTLQLENKIEPVGTFDELVYLASQAFDNNQPYHFDLLAAALIDLQQETQGENIPKLEPAFQRAYKLLLNDWQSTMGYLDHLLATFFVSYAYLLHEKFPKATASITDIHNRYVQQDRENKKRWSFYNLRIGSLESWKTHTENPAYEPYKQILLTVKEKLRQEDRLPLLSTPTHAPGWIDPAILVKRLSQYTASGVKPDSMDLQIAMSRCALEAPEEALAAAKELPGEYGHLVCFLLQPDASPRPPFTTPAAWMAAALAKTPKQVYPEFSPFSGTMLPHHYLTGQFEWQALLEAYTYKKYDYQKRQELKVHDTRKILRVRIKKQGIANPLSGIKNNLRKLLPLQKKGVTLLYEYLTLKTKYLDAEPNDIQRLLMLVPNNPELLLAQVIGQCLTYPTFWSEADRKMVTATIRTLQEIWKDFGATAHLFVATCMLSSDKTIRAFAAEIWIRGVSSDSIKSGLVGEIIGLQEQVEFAPLKRLTDLIISNMLQVSGRHNVQLEEMLTALLQQLPDEPIKNLKKLLEIYMEVLALNKSAAEKDLTPKLEAWQHAPSLSKTISRIRQLSPVGENILTKA